MGGLLLSAEIVAIWRKDLNKVSNKLPFCYLLLFVTVLLGNFIKRDSFLLFIVTAFV